ncbi:hypothetical protein VaNZ11_014086 [Volvox africanus]|uniref:RING-type domain-containing protein n=1 Tax=Volvox africanus TaxID=51714 RepID=A0ABQ5SHP6_9CHLO|nr:hypothetical protein VaNZ11_014086 [Volvox africanus]
MGCSSSIHVAPLTAAAQTAQQGATKPQPVTPDSRVLRGQAYYAAGKVAEALKEFNVVIATWPTYARAYLERGNVRLDQQDYMLAIGDYTQALQLQANLLQAYMMRCHAQMALREYAEAMQDAREAERLDPENAQVKALKAQVRKAQANVIGAGGGGGGAPGSAAVGGAGGGGDDEDAFAGLDTPKSTPSPSVRKLCMVCMDSERECRLRPCMHAALCVACAEGLMARGYGCPICSSKIDQVERGSFMRTFTVEEAQGIVASARVVAPLASPGKSPLGRRFQPGTAPVGSSLDNIVEGDEEGHLSADAAIEAAAAALAAAAAATGEVEMERLDRRRMSSGSAASSSGRATTPPVALDPHPLAGRLTSSARAARRGSGSIGGNLPELEEMGQDAIETGPPPPLPGQVVSFGGGEEATANRRQLVSGGGEAAAVAALLLDSGASQRGRSDDSSRSSGDGGGDGGDAATVTTVASSSRMDTMGQVMDYNIDSPVDDPDGVADAGPVALTAVASAFLANSLADWIEEHGGDSPSRSTAASPHAARTALPPVDEAADVTAAEGMEEAGEGCQSHFFGFAAASATASATTSGPGSASVSVNTGSLIGHTTAAEIEPETTESQDGVPSPPAGSEASAGGGTSVMEATGPVAGPVTESRCSRPASATVAASRGTLEARVSSHGSPQEHRRLQAPQEHPQRPHQWSARSLAAQGTAKAAGGGAAAAVAVPAMASSSHRALGGAYASCGAAAAAARPFTRQHTASRGRQDRAVVVAMAPSLTAAPRQQPRQRSGRRGGKLSAGGGGGGGGGRMGGGVDLHARAGPRSQGSQGHTGSGSDVMALTNVVLLPGLVPQ